MKIYRCVIGCLLVFFIALGVWYVVSCYDEQRSNEEGVLIWLEYIDEKGTEQGMRGAIGDDTDHGLC